MQKCVCVGVLGGGFGGGLQWIQLGQKAALNLLAAFAFVFYDWISISKRTERVREWERENGLETGQNKREREHVKETRQKTRNKQYNEAHLVASLNEQQQIEEDIRIHVYMKRISIRQRQNKGCVAASVPHTVGHRG